MKQKDNLKGMIVVGLLVIVAIFAGVFISNGGSFSSVEKTPEQLVAECGLATTLPITVVKEYDEGTTVSVSTKYSQDGGNTWTAFTSGSTNLVPGLPVKMFLNASNYIDKVVDLPAPLCGANKPEKIKIAATDSVDINIYDNQMNQLTDSATGGAANLSAVNVGASAKAIVELIGNNNEQSGDLIIVVETSSTSNVSEIKLGSLTKVDTPSFYTQAATGTAVQAFLLPSLNDNAEYKDTLTIIPKDAKQILGSVYLTAYSKQAFEDTNGKIVVGIENSEGTAKYEDTYDQDFFITA